MEIERKFLVRQLPETLDTYPKQRIEQAYLSADPVVRVRRLDDDYILTCKGKGLLVREEREMPLSAEAYRRLLAKAEGAVIEKDRYRIPCGSLTIELDVFDGALAPLVLAEVEFPTEEAATAFQPPEWFGEEVTWDSAYTNARLSQRQEETIRPGRYRHFKGREYEVLYTAKHSETLEPMVVYRAMYGEHGVWIRPASMWNETVERDGVTCRRFTYIGD